MKRHASILLISLFFSLLGVAEAVEGNSGESKSVTPIGYASLPPESVSLSTGETKKFEAPFAIEKFKSSSSNARINNVSGRSFELEGVNAGEAVVQISMQNLNKEYRVTVSSSLVPLYRALSRELSDLPEVGIELVGNSLTLRGEIMRSSHWDYFQRVMKRYNNDCRNYVTFQPGPELFEQLKKQLQAAGYNISEKIGVNAPGNIKLEVSPGVLTLSGFVPSTNDLATLKRIISTQKWLSPEWNGNFFRAETDFQVVDTPLDVGVVFVGVTKTQMERLGNSSADGKVLSWNLVAWFRALAGGAPEGIATAANGKGAFSYFNTGMKGSLLFFGNNGVSDFRDAGHLTLSNNGGNGATYENGGTLSIKITGQDVADLKEIDFGLKLKIKGGLVRANEVRLEVEAEKSLPPIKQDEDYFQRKTKTTAEIVCPLGKTAVLAGQKELSFSNSGPSGYAFLRHVPVVNWFTSYEEKQGEELQILILICPRLAGHSVQMSSMPSAETEQVEKTVTKSVTAQEAKIKTKEERNWFMKMFTW